MKDRNSLESKGPNRLPPIRVITETTREKRPELPFEKENRQLRELAKFLDRLLNEMDEQMYSELSSKTFSGITKNAEFLWGELVKNGYIDIEEFDFPDVDADEDGNSIIVGNSIEQRVTITDKFYKIQSFEGLNLSKAHESIKDKVYEKLNSFISLSLKDSRNKLIEIIKQRISQRFKANGDDLFTSIMLKKSIENVLNPNRVKKDKNRLYFFMEGTTKEDIEMSGYTADIPDDLVSPKEMLDEIIDEIYYDLHRLRLASWIRKPKNYDALIVNAPLGLGKSMAISNALKDKKDKSAIIFMPTIRLCNEMMKKLEGEDVFFIKGVSTENCKKFDEVMKKYDERVFSKKEICDSCDQREICPNLTQYEEAKKHRIIVATHKQYPRFMNIPKERIWKVTNKIRDFFIIDENIIASWMDPIGIPIDEFKDYMDTLIDSDTVFDYPVKEKLTELRDKVMRAMKARESTLIAPIDKDFKLTLVDLTRWENVRTKLRKAKEKTLRNLRDDFIWAIKHGLVVQKDKCVLLYNNVSYDFTKIGNKIPVPVHVFFDAIDLRDDVIENYFPNARIEKLPVKVPSLGQLSIHHVDNENLSRTTFPEKHPETKAYLDYIFSQHGNEAKYFVITTMDHEPFVRDYFKDKGMLEKVLSSQKAKEEPKGYFVICHYGNQKGINDAQKCNVGILLGTYFKSPELIITSCLPYIQDRLTNDFIIEPKIVDYVREGQKYSDDWLILKQFDFWLRSTEHEQGMGRTRHLHHDVDFYVVTMDRVQDYAIAEDASYSVDYTGRKMFSQKSRKDYLIMNQNITLAVKEITNRGFAFSPQQVAKMLGVSERKVQLWIEEETKNGRVKKIKNGQYSFHDG